jgi:nucleotide-binding universal stress UspA family protein
MCIKAVADELNADLVIFGTRGKNRAMKVLLGSVADDLLKTLSVDVLVVPCPPDAPR